MRQSVAAVYEPSQQKLQLHAEPSKANHAGWAQSCARFPRPLRIGRSRFRLSDRPAIARGRKDAGGKLRHIAGAFQRTDLADALLAHLVDAQDGMHWQHRALDAVEFALDALFTRINDDGRALAEHQLFDLDESEQPSLGHLAGIDLVNLSLVHEHDPENVAGCHRSIGTVEEVPFIHVSDTVRQPARPAGNRGQPPAVSSTGTRISCRPRCTRKMTRSPGFARSSASWRSSTSSVRRSPTARITSPTVTFS